MGKLSKTAKRNSKEPLVASVNEAVEESGDIDMFDFLDKIMASETPVVPMPGTVKATTMNLNLDSGKVQDWF